MWLYLYCVYSSCWLKCFSCMFVSWHTLTGPHTQTDNIDVKRECMLRSWRSTWMKSQTKWYVTTRQLDLSFSLLGGIGRSHTSVACEAHFVGLWWAPPVLPDMSPGISSTFWTLLEDTPNLLALMCHLGLSYVFFANTNLPNSSFAKAPSHHHKPFAKFHVQSNTSHLWFVDLCRSLSTHEGVALAVAHCEGRITEAAEVILEENLNSI